MAATQSASSLAAACSRRGLPAPITPRCASTMQLSTLWAGRLTLLCTLSNLPLQRSAVKVAARGSWRESSTATVQTRWAQQRARTRRCL